MVTISYKEQLTSTPFHYQRSKDCVFLTSKNIRFTFFLFILQYLIEDITSGFKTCKEGITTSPSHCHLGYYKLFIVSDGNDNNPDHVVFDKAILQTINTILNTTIDSGFPLTRYLSSIVVMIEKIPARPHINKLRVINIYEANNNVWPNKVTKHAVLNKTLGENQWGYIPGCSADIVATIDEFIMEPHRLTFRDVAILQNDVKACFDRIINIHAMFNS